MMDRELATVMTRLLNQRENEAALIAYASHRIEVLKNSLVGALTFEDVRAIQGKINELRRIMTLRDEANADAKKEHKQ